MQTAKAHFSGIEYFLDSGQQRDADAVAEFDQVEPKLILDFTQHDVASGVAAGVPAGGKRDHATQQRRSVFRRWAFLRQQGASIPAAREQARPRQWQRSTPPQWLAPCASQLDQIVR